MENQPRIKTKKPVKPSTRYLVYAVLIHLGFIGILVVSLDWDSTPSISTPEPEQIVQAVAVDEKQVEKELKKLKQAEQKRLRAEQARQRKLEQEAKKAKQSRKDEEKRLAELKQQQQQEAVKLKQQKEHEQKQIKELQQKKEAEAKRVAELEMKRKLEEETRMLEEAQKRMQEELDAEASALKSQQNQAVQTEVEKYQGLIKRQISNNWLQPTNFEPGSYCEVVVKLIPTGEVIEHAVKQCKGGALFQRSVESAVRKASPLPVSKDPEVFAKLRDIKFTFKPDISQ